MKAFERMREFLRKKHAQEIIHPAYTIIETDEGPAEYNRGPDQHRLKIQQRGESVFEILYQIPQNGTTLDIRHFAFYTGRGGFFREDAERVFFAALERLRSKTNDAGMPIKEILVSYIHPWASSARLFTSIGGKLIERGTDRRIADITLSVENIDKALAEYQKKGQEDALIPGN